MKRRAYRGKRRGMTAEQTIAVAILAMIAVLALTMSANSKWTGQSMGEQIYESIFVAKDWE